MSRQAYCKVNKMTVGDGEDAYAAYIVGGVNLEDTVKVAEDDDGVDIVLAAMSDADFAILSASDEYLAETDVALLAAYPTIGKRCMVVPIASTDAEGNAITTLVTLEEWESLGSPERLGEVRPKVKFDVKSEATRKITQADFLDMFTQEEQALAHASSDPMIKVFLTNAFGVQRPYIDLDHPLVQQAIPYLVSADILTQERANEILEG